MLGKKEWVVPDGFIPVKSCGDFVSHESICVLNLSEQEASIKITIYFEDNEPMENFYAICKAKRANHIRLNEIKNDKGEMIPIGVPYAMLLESDVEIVAQYSRMDTSQSELTLMTTMAYCG